MTLFGEMPSPTLSTQPAQTPQSHGKWAGNTTFRHSNTALLSVVEVTAPHRVPSEHFDERLSGTLRQLRLPKGLLQRVAGVNARRNWYHPHDYVAATAEAGRNALRSAGIAPGAVGLMINTSVTRENLEPSVAVSIHDGIGLESQAMNFDITNACLGFVNGITVAATMIDAGHIDYALIVAGEDATQVQNATVQRLSRDSITKAEYLNEFASLTLGCGAAAALLGPADKHPEAHRIIGGVSRAATWNHGLCVGDHEGMFTDTQGLLDNGMELVTAAWHEAHTDGWDWSNMSSYVMHQVSHVHTSAISKAVKLPRSRVPITYDELGNVGPASLPITLARQAETLKRGDRVLCMGVGSGLNTAMLELLW